MQTTVEDGRELKGTPLGFKHSWARKKIIKNLQELTNGSTISGNKAKYYC